MNACLLKNVGRDEKGDYHQHQVVAVKELLIYPGNHNQRSPDQEWVKHALEEGNYRDVVSTH